MTTCTNLAVLTHTHSDCNDLYGMYFDSIEMYLGQDLPHYVCVNTPTKLSRSIREVIYDKNDLFADRILKALVEIPEDFILFSLEDYILYAQVDRNALNEYLSLMQSNPEIGFIRLIQSGIVSDSSSSCHSNLVVLQKNTEYYFSTQVTIWRKSVLKRLFESYKMTTVRDEIAASHELSKFTDIVGMGVKRKGHSVGGHFDSLEYPYIATACVGGKWNISEYPRLNGLLLQYGIDPNVRGVR